MAERSSELVPAEATEGLSDLQRRFVEALVEGATAEEAKAKAGYGENTPTVSILRSKLVENAISMVCDARLRGPLRLKALKTVETLLDEGPAATRFNAAKLVLEWGEDGDQGEEKPLSERSSEELEQMIDRLEGEREARMKNVTPKNGAQRG